MTHKELALSILRDDDHARQIRRVKALADLHEREPRGSVYSGTLEADLDEPDRAAWVHLCCEALDGPTTNVDSRQDAPGLTIGPSGVLGVNSPGARDVGAISGGDPDPDCVPPPKLAPRVAVVPRGNWG